MLIVTIIVIFAVMSQGLTDPVAQQGCAAESITFYVWCSIVAAIAALGIMSGVIGRRRRILGGIFMVIAALSSFAALNAQFSAVLIICIIPSIVLLLGAGYAFVD